jgi:plasmid stabilization system protein ParE
VPRVFKQALAEKDLTDIWIYTFNEWGERQADTYLDDLAVTFNLLAEQHFTVPRAQRVQPSSAHTPSCPSPGCVSGN